MATNGTMRELVLSLLERHRSLLQQEVAAASELGFTPPLSILSPPAPDAGPDAILDCARELCEEILEARRRLLARLVETATRNDDLPSGRGPLINHIVALIDALPDDPREIETTRHIRRLEDTVAQRRQTIAKLVDKAYAQGRTIARLRQALAALQRSEPEAEDDLELLVVEDGSA